MNIVARKLDKDMQGPEIFAVLTEQEKIEYGYVWEYSVFDGSGMCIRNGISSIKDLDELTAFIESGLSRVDWDLRLKCAMTACTKDVTHIDDHGFIYCTGHGEARKAYRKCRKLRPYELNRLKRGEQLTRY